MSVGANAFSVWRVERLKSERQKDKKKTRNKEVKHWVLVDGFLVENFPPDGWVWRVSREETVTFFLKLSCDSTG